MNAHGALLTPFSTKKQLAGTAFVHLDGCLHATFHTKDFVSALELVNRVGAVAEELNHHPDVRLRYGTVSLELTSHDAGGVTARDLELAARVQQLADTLGATAPPAQPTRYEIAIDCTDADAVRPFWRVGLGYTEVAGDDGIELVDPRGIAPKVWFQHMEIARTERNRIHLDVYVPSDDAEDRVAAVLLGGGVLLTDEHAPDWWVLADVEGNELCVCTAAS
ncbi:4a-hydroxytetrahydrobiopterin dehydratase [Cryobacterium sp. PH31-O1]|uniref:4a-hydroxytetrahydrobiopterin dehydratase n=1 Tax=Cryobacterium sp. PH31-O1 TaxID=3046306 RepID=UPI0024BB69F6|nr:4a-hydroxytetrahydrobiopterin dehydratase [Cryobacterium sp. PH31-O1]MDJ0339517.1 4a-hydroxytetrahydrobiopterin dehydratase [Cryobacterium sp. PH31-O1]